MYEVAPPRGCWRSYDSAPDPVPLLDPGTNTACPRRCHAQDVDVRGGRHQLVWFRLGHGSLGKRVDLEVRYAASRPPCRNTRDVRAALRSLASAVAGVRHSNTMLR